MRRLLPALTTQREWAARYSLCVGVKLVDTLHGTNLHLLKPVQSPEGS